MPLGCLGDQCLIQGPGQLQINWDWFTRGFPGGPISVGELVDKLNSFRPKRNRQNGKVFCSNVFSLIWELFIVGGGSGCFGF